MTANPPIMIPRQPALRHLILPVLPHMIHVRREHPRPALAQIHLQDTQARRMARRVSQHQPLAQLEARARPGAPVETEGEVVRQVHPEVGLRGDGVEGVFQLDLVRVDRHVGVDEMLQAAGVVEV